MRPQPQEPRTTRRSDCSVVRADSGAAAHAFVKFPHRLYRDDPCWVPPLIAEVRNHWSPRHNASLTTRWVRRFVALRNGRVVGPIAAIVDREFADAWEPGTGTFGFFESEDDSQAPAALLPAAERALAERGVQRILGPIDLTPHDETGLLVSGFKKPATVMSPYNPSYYGRLLESAGYKPYRDYHSYAATTDSAPSPAVRRILRAARARRGVMKGVTLRNVDLRRWEAEARIVCDIYNAALAKHISTCRWCRSPT